MTAESRSGLPRAAAGIASKFLGHMGGCQNYGPFLGPYYNTAPII